MRNKSRRPVLHETEPMKPCDLSQSHAHQNRIHRAAQREPYPTGQTTHPKRVVASTGYANDGRKAPMRTPTRRSYRIDTSTLLALLGLLILLAAWPSKAAAHSVGRKQCRQYASVAALVANPTRPGNAAQRRAFRRCTKAARVHLLTHGLPIPPLLARIRGCESGGSPHHPGNYLAQNQHSTASGAYQDLDSTWARYKGYLHARQAPKRIQDEFNLRLFAASGSTPWVSSQGCWG